MASPHLTAEMINHLNPKGRIMNATIQDPNLPTQEDDLKDIPDFLRRPLTKEELKEYGIEVEPEDEDKEATHLVM